VTVAVTVTVTQATTAWSRILRRTVVVVVVVVVVVALGDGFGGTILFRLVVYYYI
jgi:hypothetical protein